MSRRLVIGAVLLGVFAISAFVLRPVGEFGVVDSRIALAHDGTVFNAEIWRSGDAARRGQMVADLVRPRRFVGVRSDSVVALLGVPDCNQFQRQEPCYRVRLGRSDYELQFPVRESATASRIVAIRLNRL